MTNPSGDFYSVNWAQQRAGAASIGVSVGVLDEKIGEIDGLVKNLLGTYSGPSEQVYLERQGQWDKSAAAIKDVCLQFQVAVNRAADIAESAEMQNVTTIGRD